MAGTIDFAKYVARFGVDLSGLSNGLEEADKKIKNSLDKSFSDMGGKMSSAGKSLAKISVPLTAIGVLATKVGSDFQASMSEVQAISGATGKDLERLTEKAKEMGASTKFSASESAEALKYMAMAGWDTEQMLGALEGVMSLAAASGEDLGLVSDIVTDALTAFGMEAKQATEFADLLASASSNSNTNVSLLGESFKYVAPLFGSLGYSAEDAALGLGLMANAGIKGGQAGTALRSAITNMIKPTDAMQIAMDKLGLSITDANGEMLPFKSIMDELRVKFKDLTEEQQAQYAATIFGQQSMSGMLAIINASEEDYAKLTDATRNYTGSAKEMADVMQENLQGRITKLKSALEGLGIKIFEIMLPYAEKMVGVIQKLVDWLDGLDLGTQKIIVGIGALIAVASPLLIIGGKVATGIGSIIGLFGKLSTVSAVTTTGVSSVASGIGGVGIAAKAGALLLNPWTLAIAGAGVAVYGLYKHLKQDAIPSIELFGDEVSENTQKSIGEFLDLEEKATIALNQLSWSGQEVTQEMSENITGNFEIMKEQIVTNLEEQKTEALQSLDELFSNSKTMSEEEKEEMIKITTEKYDEQIKMTEEGNNRIKEILEQAKEENRSITEEEKNEINKIKNEMKNDAVKVLSESEKEQLAIMERLKVESGKISAKQASEIVKNSIEQKNKTIKEAEKEYQDRLKYAAQLRADGTKESKMLADKIIEEAKRQKDESIKSAEEMHRDVVREAKQQAKEYVNEINWTSGEVKTKWEVIKTNISNSLSAIGRKIRDGINDIREWNNQSVKEKVFSVVEKVKKVFTGNETASYDVGTNFVPMDGLAFVHKGEQIIPAKYQGQPYSPNTNTININEGDIKLEVKGNLDKSILPEVKKLINEAKNYSMSRLVNELNKNGIRPVKV